MLNAFFFLLSLTLKTKSFKMIKYQKEGGKSVKKKLMTMVCAALVLSGCRTNGRQIDASFNADVYRDYMTEDNKIDSINYLATDKEKNLSLVGNLVDGLVETDKYGNLKPALAQDIGSPNADNTVWEFNIRGEVPWVTSDGTETGYFVTADDFVVGLKYVLDHESAYQDLITSLIYNADQYVAGNVSFDDVGIEYVDDYTIRYTLKSPCSYFNTYLLNGGFYPLEQYLIDEVGDDFATSPETLWYNGAYYLTKYTEDKIEYKKNKSYWEVGQVSFENGSVTLVDDNEAALKLFKQGRLSYAFIDETYAEDNRQHLDQHMYMSAVSPETYLFMFNFNTTNPVLKKALANTDFRKAIFYGMNTDGAFVTKVADNEKEDMNKSDEQATADTGNKNIVNASVQSTIIPTGFATKSDGIDYVTLGNLASFSGKTNYDADKYSQYQGLAVGALSQDTEVSFPIEIRVPINAEHPEKLLEFNRMTSKFDSSFVTFKTILYTYGTPGNDDVVKYDDIKNNYDMTLVSVGADNGDPSTYLSEFKVDGKLNQVNSHFSDEIYDGLFEVANTLTTSDARLLAFAECETYLLDKAYVIPFSHGDLYYKVSSINDYSLPRGTYGLSRYKLKGVKASEQAITINERAEMKNAYEEAKNSSI